MESHATKPSFIRRMENSLQLGDQISDFVIGLTPTYEQVKLYNLITDHLIVILASTECSACEQALEALNELNGPSNPHNTVLLVEASKDEVAELSSIFNERVKVFGITNQQMRDYLRMRYLPFGYCLAPNGVIVSMDVVSSKKALQRLLEQVPKSNGAFHDI